MRYSANLYYLSHLYSIRLPSCAGRSPLLGCSLHVKGRKNVKMAMVKDNLKLPSWFTNSLVHSFIHSFRQSVSSTYQWRGWCLSADPACLRRHPSVIQQRKEGKKKREKTHGDIRARKARYATSSIPNRTWAKDCSAGRNKKGAAILGSARSLLFGPLSFLALGLGHSRRRE